MTVAERLERIHASIQVKLAQQGMPTDRETLEEVCMAIACLVRDPDSIELHSSPMSAEDYSVVADCLALAGRDFAKEIAALRALVATLEECMQEEVRAWVDSALVVRHTSTCHPGDDPRTLRGPKRCTWGAPRRWGRL